MTEARAAREAFLEALVHDDPVQLYERAPCGFLSTTPDGVIVKCNGTFRTWIGRSAEELVGRLSFVDLLTTGGRIYHETHYAPALRIQGSVREIALDLIRGDGQRVPVLVNATMDRDEDGRPAVVRIAVFDATERREYERELLRAKQAAEASEAQVRELARSLQQTLVPPVPPEIPGLDLAAAYHPAGEGIEVGGDFYDVFPIGREDWIVLIGDVCGKGVEAAAVATLVRHTVRALAIQTAEPAGVLGRLNEVLLAHESDRFCTVCLVRLRRSDGAWHLVQATGGHPAPLLVRAAEPIGAQGDPGPLVGVLEGPRFTESRLRLDPGDVLVLYTDGVPDARHEDEAYGEDRIVSALTRQRAAPADGPAAGRLVAALVGDVLDFQGRRQRDDIAVLAVGVPSD